MIASAAVFTVSRLVLFNSDLVSNRTAYHLIAVVSCLVYFLSIVVAAAAVYPISYSKGAVGIERVIAASVNPVIWIAIEIYYTSVAFTVAESLYLGLNVGVIILAWNFTLIAVCELLCRRWARRRDSAVKVLTALPLIPIILFPFLVLLIARDSGAYYFSLLLAGYRLLFAG